MKVLVTGASGNVGRYVSEELINMGEQIVVAGMNTQKLTELFQENAEVVYFDFTNPDTFEKALANVDRVFLMRPPHLGKPEDLYPFIDAMKKAQIKLVSFLSLMGVEKNPIPPHHKIEKYIEVSGIPFAHIRPGFFMQNISGIHAVEIREKNEVFVPARKSKTSFIDAKDIGFATAIVLHEYNKYENTAHTITGSKALDYYEVAEILTNITGRKIRYAKPSYLQYRKYYINTRGLNKDYVNVTVALYFMTRMGTAKMVTDDFYQLTGKQPRTFEQFVKENIQSFS
ncbi:SDR family oxidoreductase [Bacillus kwashiorkori]|uniref:SDR family oxidoreductase n=1 Tax=Bacillus kwashiorkori TaxID=1522318 RepID=UPI000A656C81|nr:SDR family oxidoreductase [Bacillus kwashiorkori]